MIAEVVSGNKPNVMDPNLHEPTAALAIRLDVERFVVELEERRVRLTRVEFLLFRYLFVNADRVVAYEELMRNVIERTYDPESALLRVHLLKLRRKLNHWSCAVKTVRGFGLWFDASVFELSEARGSRG